MARPRRATRRPPALLLRLLRSPPYPLPPVLPPSEAFSAILVYFLSFFFWRPFHSLADADDAKRLKFPTHYKSSDPPTQDEQLSGFRGGLPCCKGPGQAPLKLQRLPPKLAEMCCLQVAPGLEAHLEMVKEEDSTSDTRVSDVFVCAGVLEVT